MIAGFEYHPVDAQLRTDLASVMNTSIEPPETIEVDQTTIACDGGGGALGHPRVFLNMGEKKEIDCPYCGRQFTLSADAPASAGH